MRSPFSLSIFSINVYFTHLPDTEGNATDNMIVPDTGQCLLLPLTRVYFPYFRFLLLCITWFNAALSFVEEDEGALVLMQLMPLMKMQQNR